MAEIHLDHAVLSALQEVMEDEYPLLLDTFLTDSEERLRQLHRADDADQLISTAHSFNDGKWCSGTIMMMEIKAMGCCDIYEAKRRGRHCCRDWSGRPTCW